MLLAVRFSLEKKTLHCINPHIHNRLSAVSGCEKSFSSKKYLVKHRALHLAESSFRCTISGCNYAFSQEDHLELRIIAHAKPFRCTFSNCFKGFNSNSSLVVHQVLHTDVKSFSCSYEGNAWAFIHQSDCKRHMSIHKGGSPHICSHLNCGLRFTAKHNLKAHEKLHTEKPYACRHGKRLKSQAELTYHVDGHVKGIDSVLVLAASSGLTAIEPSAITAHINEAQNVSGGRQCSDILNARLYRLI